MPWLFWGLLGLAVVLTFGLIILSGRLETRRQGLRVCGICGAQLRRKKFRWDLGEGNTVIACANCTKNLEARQSRAAVAEFLKDRNPPEDPQA
jgi:hypothetical protein